MNEESIVARTRAYIQTSFLQARPGFALGDTDPLFANGIIDSMGALELLAFLEHEFGIVVADDDVTEQNIGTLADIARFVASKRSNGGPA